MLLVQSIEQLVQSIRITGNSRGVVHVSRITRIGDASIAQQGRITTLIRVDTGVDLGGIDGRVQLEHAAVIGN